MHYVDVLVGIYVSGKCMRENERLAIDILAVFEKIFRERGLRRGQACHLPR